MGRLIFVPSQVPHVGRIDMRRRAGYPGARLDGTIHKRIDGLSTLSLLSAEVQVHPPASRPSWAASTRLRGRGCSRRQRA